VIRRPGGTAQRSRQLPRAAGVLGRQIASEKKREKADGKREKIEESEKRKERQGQRKIEKRNVVNGLGSLYAYNRVQSDRNYWPPNLLLNNTLIIK
jgi:hypothetical protein